MSTNSQKNESIIRLFISYIEQRNIPAFLDLFADDGVQYNYFHDGLLPAEVRGKEALKAFWTPIPDKFIELHFPIETIYPMLDAACSVMKYRVYTTLKGSNNHYNNEYLALFFFNEE